MEGAGRGGRPRFTLLDQMSAIAADGRDLAGLTLDDILTHQKLAAASAPPPDTAPSPLPEMPSRTLLEIIRDEDPKASSCKGFSVAAASVVNRDRRSWRSFKDRLSLNRSGSGAGANWTSSVHVPTSDLLIPTSRSMVSRRNSVGSLFADSPPRSDESPQLTPPSFRPQISRRSSCRLAPNTSFASDPTDDNVGPGANSNRRPTLRPQISRRHSTRLSPETDDFTSVSDSLPAPTAGPRRLSVVLAEERSLSAREAVAAQEAAENAAEESETDSPPAVALADSVAPVRMSLMDLLEETDRQMGFVGSRYTMNDEEDEEDYDEEDEEVAGGTGAGAGVGNAVARNCCVCMVRHKGAAFIPCGHTFCRLCSRELWVSRGNCPLCNGFILEILDIF